VTICAHADLFLQSPVLAMEAPDLVVRVGALPTSRRIQDALARHRPEVIHIQPDLERHDPEAWDSTIMVGPVAALCDRLTSSIPEGNRAPGAGPWAQVEASVRAALLERPLPIEAEAVRRAADLLPPNGVLFFSNSLPIRWGEAYLDQAADAVTVHVSRGANGIDGIVSTALGIAHGSGGPTLAVLGDLAFLHDVGGLQAAHLVRSPALLLVLNNNGGGIFAQLPIARFESLSPLFETPHDAALEHASRLFGLPHARADSVDALVARAREALDRPGVTVIELASDRRAVARAHAACVAAIVEKLEARGG
jgi:2-succinyl-5-enolpyruvyl-6-hydroxy-3-cyclohexene-1-carboxylate synthase